MNKYDEAEVSKAIMNANLGSEEEQKGQIPEAIKFYEAGLAILQTQIVFAPLNKKPLIEIGVTFIIRLNLTRTE